MNHPDPVFLFRSDFEYQLSGLEIKNNKLNCVVLWTVPYNAPCSAILPKTVSNGLDPTYF
jgi:hypothetical protein